MFLKVIGYVLPVGIHKEYMFDGALERENMHTARRTTFTHGITRLHRQLQEVSCREVLSAHPSWQRAFLRGTFGERS